LTLRFLLDTNVVSEPLRPVPDPAVEARLREHGTASAVAAVVWHELRFGAARLPESRRRSAIEEYLATVVAASFPILPYDDAAATWHARERARLTARGLTPSFVDGQIAAIAHVHRLTLVTANRGHFEPFRDLEIEDWRSPV